MNKNAVSVFLGHPIEEPTEREFLARLRSDLEPLGPAVVLANFYAGRAQRQIDFVVVTADRAVHCELKGFSLPTIGKRNGCWQQRLSDGTLRELDGNCYDQANQGTYAISDAVRRLRRADPSLPGDAMFYRSLDTVVCLFPHIPHGSEFEHFAHVAVLGYDDLLARLQQPRRKPPWNRQHWEALIRELSLTPIDERSPDERTRAQLEQQFEDYRRRFKTSLANGLPPLVGIRAQQDGIDADATGLGRLARTRDTVFLVGESGAGKSHLARHAAIEMTGAGGLVAWVPALEYERGRLSALLRRATAPYSTVDGIELIRRAVDMGVEVTLVVDGLNECPPDAQSELLDQIGALRLRTHLAVIVSAQEEVAAPEALEGVTLRLLAPSQEARYELLEIYGASGAEDLFGAFSTPHELSIAAQCSVDLPASPTRADLFDAYVRRRVTSTAVRVGLRLIASMMRSQYRLSVQVDEAWRLLSREPTLGSSPAAVDAAFASPLLRAQQGRLSFVHEDFARFLASEHLTLSAEDGRALGKALRVPRHADLRDLSLSLEIDDLRLRQALVELADPDVIAAAVRGSLGPKAQTAARDVVHRALAAAYQVSEPANCRLEMTSDTNEPFANLIDGVSWMMDRPLATKHEAPLEAAGICLREGYFVEEVGDLLTRTDVVCARAAQDLADAGSKRAISVTVAATYPQLARKALPASRVLYACEMNEMGRWREHSPTAEVLEALAGELGRRPNWGRLYTAVLLMRRGSGVSDDFILELIKAGWDAVAYHLRLSVLDLAQRFAWRLSKSHRVELASWLQSLEDPGLMLGSSVLEALAACNAIDSGRSVADIHAEIDAVLGMDESQGDELAAGIVTNQLEEQALVGPYCEALEELTAVQRTKLFAKAVRGVEADSFFGDFVVGEAAKTDLEDADLRQALIEKASVMPLGEFGSQSVISSHLTALDACAGFLAEPPVVEIPQAREETVAVWRGMDRLLFAIFQTRRGMLAPNVSAVWGELTSHLIAEVPAVLQLLQLGGTAHARDVSPHDLLIEEHSAEVRRLLEWALNHPTDAVGALSVRELPEYAIDVLGKVGDRGTAELLRGYLDHEVLGPAAVRAINHLEGGPASTVRRRRAQD